MKLKNLGASLVKNLLYITKAPASLRAQKTRGVYIFSSLKRSNESNEAKGLANIHYITMLSIGKV